MCAYMCLANFYVCWFFGLAKGLYEIMRYTILDFREACWCGKKEEGTCGMWSQGLC